MSVVGAGAVRPEAMGRGSGAPAAAPESAADRPEAPTTPATSAAGRARGEPDLGRRGLGLGLAALAVAALGLAGWASATGAPRTVEVAIRFSAFAPSEIHIPAGRAVTFVLRNADPIDHEWIVGDTDLHRRHRTGTEPVHAERPTEVTIPAGETRTTTVVFETPGRFAFICHLPGHEAYGMTGSVVVAGG